MKHLAKTIAIICLSAPASMAPVAFAEAGPTAAECRPLTQANIRECCSAANWRALTVRRDEGLCVAARDATERQVTVAATDEPGKPYHGTKDHDKKIGGLHDKIGGTLDHVGDKLR